ncbi:MAG: hypothetical protein HYR55_16270 [Acidobacteria bacterium]|nr:hypothetical protein [Acidobacteriota bacterium]MBI3655481.1 hypothetical protein [Acidobacteriota bacterium]
MDLGFGLVFIIIEILSVLAVKNQFGAPNIEIDLRKGNGGASFTHLKRAGRKAKLLLTPARDAIALLQSQPI